MYIQQEWDTAKEKNMYTENGWCISSREIDV